MTSTRPSLSHHQPHHTVKLTHTLLTSFSMNSLSAFSPIVFGLFLSTLSAQAVGDTTVSSQTSARSVNQVSWQKQIASDIERLLDEPVASNQTRVFFIRPHDADDVQTSVNIAINNRFQTSLHPGNFTYIDTCAGKQDISALMTRQKSNDLDFEAQTYVLDDQAVHFFYVEVDSVSDTLLLKQIDKDSALASIADKNLQAHQISRVSPSCPMFVPAPSTPDPDPAPAPTPAPAPAKIFTPLPVTILQSEPPPLDAPLTLKVDVLFDTNKAIITPQYVAKVAKLAQFLTEHPTTTVVIEGHTDNTGQANYNLALSQKRADAVKAMLVQDYDIAVNRITAKGYGEDRPIASNRTESGRQENRRVMAIISQ